MCLRQVTVDGSSSETVADQFVGHARRFFACAHEHQRALFARHQQHVDDCLVVLAVADAAGEVFDVVVGFAGRGALDLDRLVLEAVGKRQHCRRERRRHEVRAANFRKAFEDPVELVLEAEVEHLVRFVEHELRHRGDVDRATAEMVEQAAWRADEHGWLAAQTQTFAIEAGATGHDFAIDAAQVGEEPRELFLDLHRELTRWRNDQRRWSDAILVADSLGECEANRDRLARTRL